MSSFTSANTGGEGLFYAGAPLCVPTEQVSSWIEANISPKEVWDFYRMNWPGKNRTGWTFPGTTPARPIRINTLWWPTGASRFAVGYFLCTDRNLEAINQVTAGGTIAQPFAMTTANGGIATKLYALPARPLSARDPDSRQMWLLTLVDQRYFWWYISSGIIPVTSTTSWSDLIGHIQSALNITILTDAIPAGYFTPSPSLTTRYEFLPLLLDAVAYNLGMRLVCWRDGTIYLMSVDSSREVLGLNFAAYNRVQAGGLVYLDSSLLPSQVIVTFPKAGVCTADPWAESVTMASLEFGNVTLRSGSL